MRAIISIVLKIATIAAIIFLPLILLAGCNEHLMPDQVSISTFQGPMSEDYYIYGFSWDIPQAK